MEALSDRDRRRALHAHIARRLGGPLPIIYPSVLPTLGGAPSRHALTGLGRAPEIAGKLPESGRHPWQAPTTSDSGR